MIKFKIKPELFHKSKISILTSSDSKNTPSEEKTKILSNRNCSNSVQVNHLGSQSYRPIPKPVLQVMSSQP